MFLLHCASLLNLFLYCMYVPISCHFLPVCKQSGLGCCVCSDKAPTNSRKRYLRFCFVSVSPSGRWFEYRSRLHQLIRFRNPNFPSSEPFLRHPGCRLLHWRWRRRPARRKKNVRAFFFSKDGCHIKNAWRRRRRTMRGIKSAASVAAMSVVEQVGGYAF